MKKQVICVVWGFMFIGIALAAWAQQEVSPVEVNGDNVEFDIKERKVVAEGNVLISRGEVTLKCDRAEFFRDTEIAKAYGHVIVERPGGRMEGENMVFNFKTLKGDFDHPLFTSPPVYGSGERLEKIADNHFRVHRGFISTCDFDDPQTRIKAKTIDVYPGDKAVARNMIFKVGKVPVFYLPKYTEDLKDRSSIVRIMPGYTSDWGAFLLSRWRFDKDENFKTFIHVDYRERKDLAWGVDNQYKTSSFGEGLLRTYYMNERTLGVGHTWDERTSPTIEKERYKIEWRHRWEIDRSTMALFQYYKLSDSTFLKDYFEPEYDRDETPDSYALFIRGLTHGTFIARADFRANRFMSTIDRLPEVQYSLPSLEVFDSNFYIKNSTTYSNLKLKPSSPADAYAKTERFDLYNEVFYPAKIAFIEVKPFAGMRNTYYSRTKEPMMQNAVRGIFRTGVDASTKFYRVYEAQTNAWGLDIHQLRHVITPSVAYEYQDNPTVEVAELDQYDSIDALDRVHKATLSLENKLQTKRGGVSVDLVRLILSTDFAFKQDADLPSSYNNMKADLEVRPYPWLGLYFDMTHNPQTDDFESANFDVYINDFTERWYFRLGERYHYAVDHLFETEVGWRINPKWWVRVNQRYDFETWKDKGRQLSIRRDLHSWFVDILLNRESGDGTELLFMFTLKGFDDVTVEAGRTYGGGSEQPGAQIVD